MSRNAVRWRRLQSHLDALGAADVDRSAARVGAVLVLLAERHDDMELVLTLRRDDLPTHPGQVSFPGGRREPGETTQAAALREANEEIGLLSTTAEVLGRLPAFYIPPSRFWMAPIVARWRRPHPLRPQETEVSSIVRGSLSLLADPARWRKVRLSATGWSWAWTLDDGQLLWGATGMVVAVMLDVIEPDWRDGITPGDLPDDREAMPWLDPKLQRRVRPARLPDATTEPREDVTPPVGCRRDRVEDAGRGVARATRQLVDGAGAVVVLAGSGGTGAVGVATAAALRDRGVQVTIIGSHTLAEPFTGTLPVADIYIDALVGGGLEGRLHGAPLDMMLALRAHAAPILSVDLPSGLHPTDGLIGDAVTATVTVALDGMWPALDHVGLSPFVGDLYLWRPGSDDVVRLIGGPERTTTGGGWRE